MSGRQRFSHIFDPLPEVCLWVSHSTNHSKHVLAVQAYSLALPAKQDYPLSRKLHFACLSIVHPDGTVSPYIVAFSSYVLPFCLTRLCFKVFPLFFNPGNSRHRKYLNCVIPSRTWCGDPDFPIGRQNTYIHVFDRLFGDGNPDSANLQFIH